MAAGSWGAKPGERPGATPTHMTGWSKVQAGFVTSTILSADTTGTMLYSDDDAAHYRLYRVNTTRNGEYYLLENRPSSGYDLGLAGLAGLSGAYTGGLAIMHIDDNQIDNTDPTHKRVDIVEANAAELDLPSPAHNSGSINSLFFSPNRDTLLQSDTRQYDGTTTGIEVTNVSTPGAVMTADIKVN
jgi:immune inhibitor A